MQSSKDIVKCIEELQLQLDRHKSSTLKEYPTRTIFIDPLLYALGWDVRDPEEVELEYPTIDGKSVDYAPKINGKPVLFIEAKPLQAPLENVKSITQVVSYAANAGVEWCILTNGVTYKIYSSIQKVEATEKLLYEISIDSEENEGMTIQQIAERFKRFSRESMSKGLLDAIGEQIFTTSKVRKALDKLFRNPTNSVVRSIRKEIDDDTIKPKQIREALRRLWAQTSDIEVSPSAEWTTVKKTKENGQVDKPKYDETHHLKGKPQEIIELFRTVDQFCKELDPNSVQRTYLAKYIKYTVGGSNIFCCLHPLKKGIRVWLDLNYFDLANPPENVRDVSNIGHWGVGDVEISIDSAETFQDTKHLVKKSFEKNRLKG